MSENSYSEQLRILSNNYYYNQIPFEEYRTQRKIILDKIDEEFNGDVEDDWNLHTFIGYTKR